MNLKLIENLNKLELKNEFTKNFIKIQNEKFQCVHTKLNSLNINNSE